MYINISSIKKILIIDIIILLLIISIVLASNTYMIHNVDGNESLSYTYFWSSDFRSISHKLKGSSKDETINNTLDYVRNNMDYEFHWKPRGVRDTWIEMKGDCTDGSHMIQKMLRNNNIYIGLVHGWCYDADGSRLKHDWIEYNNRIIDSTNDCYIYKKVGSGVW